MSTFISAFMKLIFQFAESEVFMELDMLTVGERIKKRRNELGLSQTDIYKECEITSGALSKIENGKTVPSVFVFYKLSVILKCDMNWLLTGVSSNVQHTTFCRSEENLLNSFRQLSEDDQQEIYEIIQLKILRAKHKTPIKLSPSELNDLQSIIA